MIAPTILSGSLAMRGSTLAGVGIEGFIMGSAALAHLMAKPNSARIMAAITNGKKLGSDEFISRIFVNALQGTGAVLAARDEKGIDHPFTINAKGEAVPVEDK
jgi:hypothetical protein